MAILRVCYKSGVRFDEQYYTTKHAALAGAVMGPYGLDKVEVIRVTSAADGSTAPYQVIFTAYFDSAANLKKAMTDPRIGEVMADIANFYDGMPDVMIGEVVPL